MTVLVLGVLLFVIARHEAISLLTFSFTLLISLGVPFVPQGGLYAASPRFTPGFPLLSLTQNNFRAIVALNKTDVMLSLSKHMQFYS